MFRFTIRDVLVVTGIVALGAGWWVDRSRVHARLTKELEWRAKLVPVDVFSPNNFWLERVPATPNRP